MRYRISLNDSAPSDVGIVSLGGHDVDLSDTYETEDRNVIGNAEIHPWFDVEAVDADAADEEDVPVPEKTVEERAQEVDRPTGPGQPDLSGDFDEEEDEGKPDEASDYDYASRFGGNN